MGLSKRVKDLNVGFTDEVKGFSSTFASVLAPSQLQAYFFYASMSSRAKG